MAVAILNKLAKSEMGWNFSITLMDGNCDIEATAGDCNCPHAQEYDPKDGHGWSCVETELEAKTFAHAAALTAWRIARIKPGAKR
jgi:hypothetical protein